MKKTGNFVLGIMVLWLGGVASCSHSVEGFCQSWVEDTCQAATTCCVSGFKFDLETCKKELSGSCQSDNLVELVHGGEVVFDQGSASECVGSFATCADFTTGAQQSGTFAQKKACANAFTGYRPAGSACSNANECQKGGDYPTCYQGMCAKVVLATDSTCSFSFDTLELHACPDGTFCDLSSVKPTPNAPPSAQEVFSAKCKPLPGAGQACDANACAAGLACNFNGTGSVCTAEKAEGADCSKGGACLPGLQCMLSGAKQICQKANGPGCYSPSSCGDGVCAPGEIQTCPQDCGAGGFCGDGVCEGNEPATCPEDCTGGGTGGATPGCGVDGDPCGSGTDCCSGICDPQQNICTP